MSGLRIISLPAVAAGYRLAGADVHSVETAAAAGALLRRWLNERETGLVAVDERLLGRLDPALLHDVESYGALPLLPLPSGEPVPPERTGRSRIVDIIREAVGFHITFGERP